MMRRLRPLALLALAPWLLGAAPAVLTARLGAPLTLSIPLPAGATVAGYPDLRPFALRTAPVEHDGTLTLELLPLRPGRHTFPALPLAGPFGRETETAAQIIEVSSPEPPAALHPFKPLPRPASAKTPARWRPLAYGGLAVLALLALGALAVRRRHHQPPPPTPLDLLARRFAACADHDAPRWTGFRQHLDRLRFAPLAPTAAEIETLCAQFEQLQRETPP